MSWKKKLKKAARGGIDENEIKEINEKYQKIDRSDLITRAEDKGYTLNWQTEAEPAEPAPGGGAISGADQPNPNDLATIFQNYGIVTEAVANIQADATKKSATLRADADKEVARAYADAQKYASQLGLEGVKYGADKESEWRQAVSNIEVKGKLDLQPIINAGLERVTGIEAQAARDVAETTGRYGLESTKTQAASQEKLGKMQMAGSMYGLLSSIFG
jgi:hypothetical protein